MDSADTNFSFFCPWPTAASRSGRSGWGTAPSMRMGRLTGTLAQSRRRWSRFARIRASSLQEFSDVAGSLANTFSYVHGEDEDKYALSNPDLVFTDQTTHPPFGKFRVPTTQLKISLVSHAQFRWLLQDGSYFSEPGVCRVSSEPEGGDSASWVIWDLDASRPPLCNPCTAHAKKPTRHGKAETCPRTQDKSKGGRGSRAGIKINVPDTTQGRGEAKKQEKAAKSKNKAEAKVEPTQHKSRPNTRKEPAVAVTSPEEKVAHVCTYTLGAHYKRERE